MIFAYHGSEHNLIFDELIENASSTRGWHFGTMKAAVVAVNKYKNAEDWNDDEIQEFFKNTPECFIEVKIIPDKIYENATDSQVNSDAFLDKMIKEGYDCISYINEFEDEGSISYVVLNPGIITEI